MLRRNNQKVLPEADTMNFASRVKVPVLMINGRYDFEIPLETCQEPLFRLLGTSPPDKRHVLYDTGHSPPLIARNERGAELAGSLSWPRKVSRGFSVDCSAFVTIILLSPAS